MNHHQNSGPPRTCNPLLAELNWRTSVLFTEDGLDSVKERVPILQVSI
jgi:hypothetical protein